MSYTPKQFRTELQQRVPAMPDSFYRAPFELNRDTRSLVRETVRSAPEGMNPVWVLVDLLANPTPEGFGLEYDWSVSASALQTIRDGTGDCVALAHILVGAGRALGWPIYFAEAKSATPVVHDLEQVTVLSGHMVVVALAQNGRVVVDFLGLVEDEEYTIEVIDDLTAYAHPLNNIAGHQVINGKPGVGTSVWERARSGFELATRVQPNLGRAWNNLGIAYARLGLFAESRHAYQRAIELNSVFGSPKRNLMIMETRALNGTTLLDRSR